MRLKEIENIEYFGKIPPQSIKLEKEVIGTILLEQKCFTEVAKVLTHDSFYLPAHREVFKACEQLYKENLPIDQLTVAEYLTKVKKIEEVGGIYFISQLTDTIASSANIEYHALILAQYALKRNLITQCQKTITECYQDDTDCWDVLDAHTLSISHLDITIRKSQTQILNDIMVSTIAEMQVAKDNTNELLGISCGVKRIDAITNGFANSDNIVIAGGAGEGKSTFALQTAIHASTMLNIPVLYFALEMSAKQLAWKIISSEIGESVSNIRKGNLGKQQWDMLYNAYDNKFSNTPLHITDIAGITIFDVINISRAMHSENGLGLIVIDYLQLLSADGAGKKFGTREQEVAFMSRKVKQLAKELNVPILNLSQVSRLDKSVKRPYRLSDLRESGAIEQDADMVIFLWNPEKHEVEYFDPEKPFLPGTVIPIIAKNRLGDTGIIEEVFFNGEFSRLEDRFEQYYYTIQDKF